MPRYLILFSVFALLVLPVLQPEPGSAQDRLPIERQLVRNNNLGVAFMEQLNFEEAGGHFEKNRALDERFVPGHVNVGIARFYQQNYEEAEAAFRRALEIDPEQRQANYMLGLIHRQKDEIPAAIESLSRVLEADPDDPATNYYLALCHISRRDYGSAIPRLRQVIERQPYNASAHYNLATALNRSGSREEARQEFEVFRGLQGQFGTSTIGLQYLEQGAYSFVLDDLNSYLSTPAGSPPPIQVRFQEVSEGAGLRSAGLTPSLLSSRQVESHNHFEQELVPFLGGGVSFGDYDGDRDLDLLVAGGRADGPRLYRNDGAGKFQDVSRQAGLPAVPSMAGLWGDLNNDGHIDLYLLCYGANRLLTNNGSGGFRDVTDSSGTGDTAWSVAGALVDVDHDGDLDIAVGNFAGEPERFPVRFPDELSGSPNRLFRNNGDGTFADVSTAAGLSGEDLTVGVAASDFDNSRDIDLYLTHLDRSMQLLSNQRDGSFRDVASDVGIESTAAGVGLGDLTGNGFVDLVLADRSGVTARLASNRNLHFNVDELPSPGGSGSFQQAEMLDFDNDGDLDVLLAGGELLSGGSGGRLTLLENRGGTLHDATERVGLPSEVGQPLRGLSVGDYDNDGDLDFSLGVAGGGPLLFRNDGGNRNNWLSIRLVGTNSNRLGIGTKVEIAAGRHWQKREARAGSGLLSQNPARLHFGLGRAELVDAVRLLWPGGVLQSEIDRPVNQMVDIQELDRKGTSCPILYVWDGNGYRFQTDFLGGSAFGALLSPGRYNYPDTDEYVKLDRDAVALRDGRVSITLNNQLEEAIFFDRVQLLAVDHPAGYEVFPDEKLLSGPPYGSFQVVTPTDPVPPVGAWDGSGDDVLEEIRQEDRRYPAFQQLPFKGYAVTHDLMLDLGPVRGEHTWLLMNAWIDYADSTSNLAAWQAGHTLVPPYLQVEDPEGQWVTVIEDMGFPAGLPKTMTVDLSGRFLSDARRVRIVTNMRIHWDQILIADQPPRNDFRVHRMEAERAELGFFGFPEFTSPDGHLPRVYDRSRLSTTSSWKVHIGGYTRFGDVRPLLSAADDMYVITRSGDQIEADFEVGRLPQVPSGWQRDYFVYVVGFGKDMDVNSAAPDFVGPLPFHGMSRFPYPATESYPDTPAHREYLKLWNTRWEGNWTPDHRLLGLPAELLSPADPAGSKRRR